MRYIWIRSQCARISMQCQRCALPVRRKRRRSSNLKHTFQLFPTHTLRIFKLYFGLYFPNFYPTLTTGFDPGIPTLQSYLLTTRPHQLMVNTIFCIIYFENFRLWKICKYRLFFCKLPQCLLRTSTQVDFISDLFSIVKFLLSSFIPTVPSDAGSILLCASMSNIRHRSIFSTICRLRGWK